MEGGSQGDAAVVRGDDRGQGNAHPQHPAPVQVGLVDEPLQLPGQEDAEVLHLRNGRMMDLPVGHLPQLEIRRHKAQPGLCNGHANGVPGIGHDLQAHGPPSAGGALLPGVAHQSRVHQLRQVLIHRGQAQPQVTGQGLLGAKVLGFIEVPVDAVARLAAALSDGRFQFHDKSPHFYKSSLYIRYHHCNMPLAAVNLFFPKKIERKRRKKGGFGR